jgi:POT family proton-dependent oligopeptide transporter
MNTTKQWFGHPRGLATLFFTEMWERFSYYGMRAILVLALVDAITHGGQGLNDRDATAIYGLYTAGIYVFSLAGGWLSDRILGQHRSVLIGGIIIALGHFTMALPFNNTFYLGMLFIVLGNGLFKSAIGAMVGLLYSNDSQARRDAGYSIFYMAINLGAFIGQIICGYLGERLGWHYGFGAAGIFMLLGIMQFWLTRNYLAHIESSAISQDRRLIKRTTWIVAGFLLSLLIAGVALANHWIVYHAVDVTTNASKIIALVIAAYFIYVLLLGGLTRDEQKRVITIMIMVFVATFFWSGFEQAGSSFNLFADRYTDRTIMGWEVPASWMQSVNSFFIITLAPVFAALWLRLGMKQLNPSMPIKLGIGLIQLGLGFLVLYFAARFVVLGVKVAPTWLIVTYLLHSTGELCLSPVGMSTVSQLSPARYAAQMIGAWYMSIALGNALGGLIAGHLGSDAVNEMPYRFLMVFACTAGVGLLLVLLAKWVNQLTSNQTSQ